MDLNEVSLTLLQALRAPTGAALDARRSRSFPSSSASRNPEEDMGGAGTPGTAFVRAKADPPRRPRRVHGGGSGMQPLRRGPWRDERRSGLSS